MISDVRFQAIVRQAETFKMLDADLLDLEVAREQFALAKKLLWELILEGMTQQQEAEPSADVPGVAAPPERRECVPARGDYGMDPGMTILNPNRVKLPLLHEETSDGHQGIHEAVSGPDDAIMTLTEAISEQSKTIAAQSDQLVDLARMVMSLART